MRRTLTKDEARILSVRSGISGKAWDEARWVDGRQVIVSGPGGNLLADMALVMPATARACQRRGYHDPATHGWVGAEAIEMAWEEVAFRLSGGSKTFGPGSGPSRPYWERKSEDQKEA
jgi:hypothetical protein